MRKVTIHELRQVARDYADAGISKIYCHWSAGRYNNPEPAYHISIVEDGTIYLMHDLDEHLAATWKRNSGSVAVSMMCCYDAICYGRNSVDFGSEPPTMAQVSAMAKVVCVLCEELGLSMDYEDVKTHAEAADIDGYGVDDDDPEMRWDLLLLRDSDGEYKPGGQVIRGMAIWFHYNDPSIHIDTED